MKFLDISSQDMQIQKKILKGIKTVVNTTDFILGNKVKEFEKEFSKFCDVKYGVGCANKYALICRSWGGMNTLFKHDFETLGPFR